MRNDSGFHAWFTEFSMNKKQKEHAFSSRPLVVLSRWLFGSLELQLWAGRCWFSLQVALELVQVWQKGWIFWQVRSEGWGEDWDEGELAVVSSVVRGNQTLMKMDENVWISIPSYFVISFCYAFYKSACSLRIPIHWVQDVHGSFIQASTNDWVHFKPIFAAPRRLPCHMLPIDFDQKNKKRERVQKQLPNFHEKFPGILVWEEGQLVGPQMEWWFRALGWRLARCETDRNKNQGATPSRSALLATFVGKLCSLATRYLNVFLWSALGTWKQFLMWRLQQWL